MVDGRWSTFSIGGPAGAAPDMAFLWIDVTGEPAIDHPPSIIEPQL